MSRSTRVKSGPQKRRLTELAVRKLKPKAARAYLVWDTLQRGLAIQVQPTGSKSWKTIYSFHGRPRWLHHGDASAIGLADARTLAAEAMLAVARGRDPAAEKRAERGSGTFADLAAKYVEQYAKQHNKSWEHADKLVRRYVLPRIGKLPAASVTRSDISTTIERIGRPALANLLLALTSAIFTWAVKEELVTVNPCKLIDRHVTRSRERILSAGEMPVFWRAFELAGPVRAAALRTILMTGQRPGEVRLMRREHIKDGWWQMPGEPVPTLGWKGTKNAANHRVWLPKPVQELIGGGANGFVFAGPRGQALSGLDDIMRTICDKLKIADGVRPHDLRRTHGSTITALGFGRDAMNRIQNHREGGIADVYDRHRYEAENKQVMETVVAHIMALVEGAQGDKVVPLRRA